MKKSLMYFIIFILLISFIKPINAQDEPLSQVVPGLTNENIEKVQTGIEKLTDEQARNQYLKQEWGKILANNTYYIKYVKPIETAYNKTAPFTNPIFKYTIGMTPSLSWAFVLSVIVWIAFCIYFYRIFSMVPVFSKNTQTIITIGFIIIFSVLGISKIVAGFIIGKLSLFDNWIMQLIGIGIVIIVLILGSIFSKNLEDLFKYAKEKKEKMQEERDRKKLKANVKVGEALTKEITGK